MGSNIDRSGTFIVPGPRNKEHPIVCVIVYLFLWIQLSKEALLEGKWI